MIWRFIQSVGFCFIGCWLVACTSSEPPSDCPRGDWGCRDAEYALRHTEEFLQQARENPEAEAPLVLAGPSNEGCWELFQEQMAQGSSYELNVLMNAQALPNPERDVMQVLLEVDFASGERATLMWYAEGLGSCGVGTDD